MYKILLIAILSLCLNSCWPGFILFNTKKEAKATASVKYSGKGTDIEEHININGFYIIDDGRPLLVKDTVAGFPGSYSGRNCVMFLDDGTIAEFTLYKDSCCKTEDDIRDNLYRYINERKIPITRCGIYKIVGNDIYTNSFDRYQYIWTVENPISRIEGYEHLLLIHCSLGWPRISNDIIFRKYVFFPINEQTEPLNMRYVNRYVKKQKWLWEDEADWKKWKQEQKETRRK